VGRVERETLDGARTAQLSVRPGQPLLGRDGLAASVVEEGRAHGATSIGLTSSKSSHT